MMKISKLCRPAALVCACLLLAGCGKTEYETVRPEEGFVEGLVEDTGTVAYRESYSLIPVVNGKILSCSFDEGDEVRAGDELYVIDSTALEDQITQARQSLNTAREACRQAVEAQDDLTVLAKASGTVTAVYVHEGDFVSTGAPIAQIVDSGNLTLTVPFFKEDAAMIAVGSEAVITFPAYSDALAGTVARIYEASTPLSGGREGVYIEFSLVNPGALTAGSLAMAAVGTMTSMESAPVAYATEQAVYATQSGQVLTLPLQVGGAVAVGQVVMTIDNAAVTNAAANAALALESAQISLSQLEAKRGDYRILAPVDGIITGRFAKTGDYAAAATPMATMVEPGDMCVNAAIDELYIDQIWPGQSAQVTFTADSGETRAYTAQVRRVDDTGITAGGVTDYMVELSLENTEGLKAGMNVDVSITTSPPEPCLRVPSAAVRGGTVQVLRDGKAVDVEVTTAGSSGGYTVILSGLTAQDEVILP